MEAQERLTPEELSAMASAATWYAKYHARMIAERSDDPSAYATAQRERYQALMSALRKMGVRLIDPAEAGTADSVEAKAA